MTATIARPHGAGAAPAVDTRPALDLLWEEGRVPGREIRGRGMPAELERRYGGDMLVPLRPDEPTVIANFVSTLDGIVALGGGDLSGGGLISGFHEPDRFVMALLRGMADMVVVGAGTLRGSRSGTWTPGNVHPGSAEPIADWRASMGLTPNPTTVFVTGSGDIPVRHPGLTNPEVPVVIATTPAGAQRLASMPLAPNVSVEAVGDGETVGGRDLIGLGARLGARLILTEGGPHLLGEVVREDLLDELFLTVAPQLVGRAGSGRLGLVEGLGLAPADSPWHDLASVRKSRDHLFLRYRRRDGGRDTRQP